MKIQISPARTAGALIPFAATAVAILFCASLAGQSADPAHAADNPNAYKALYSDKCGACHNLPDPVERAATVDRWRGIVANMSAKAAAAGVPITPDDQAHIVEYLGQFPPKQTPQNNDPLATRREDVWATEPLRSHVFTFSSASQLSLFQTTGAKWTPIPGYVSAPPSANPATISMLIHKSTPLSGGVNLQAEFKFGGTSSGKTAGIVFDYVDARNYFVAVADLAKSEVRVTQLKDGLPTDIATAPLGVTGGDPQGWHSMRLMYRPETQRLTMWVDTYKKLVTPLATYADGGQFGLVSLGATTASFRNLAVDLYASPTGPPNA